ncbi:acyl carrier protein [Aliterella atlantica]|uniref:Phosphopantetheine-binding protein n=1 Tax=Aliterella atlantica CENA595 TaxID=1618023 RepID=A0A0D8ZSE7_9CYAN|nr:acyl carrier protein [Aliterella atlantica]KJH71678.1 phosphopantetheine-binding protein [Aliterella atlantica CENA595]
MEVQNLAVNEMVDSAAKLPAAAEIQDWIVNYLADLLEIEPDEVDVTIPFDRYGLDSSAAVGMTGDLETWLGRELDPTLLYDYPTVEALVQHISSQSRS